MPISYTKGYKYQLAKDYLCTIGLTVKENVKSDYIAIVNPNILIIKRGYAWDGPSGPTIDTKNFMRGSLVHDALYQLIREGLLSPETRLQADREIRKICIEDGMSKIRAWYIYKFLQLFAGFAAEPKNKREILKAP